MNLTNLRFFRRFAKLLGCDESSLKECAKKKTFQEIIDAQSQIYPKEHVVTFCPVVDGYFLPGTEMNCTPRVRQSGQSLILDSRYWISYSTCWKGPEFLQQDSGFQSQGFLIFQAKIPQILESGLPYISCARMKSPTLSPASKRETDPRLNNISQQE